MVTGSIADDNVVLVAVPVLNEELTISACLRSLLEQDYPRPFRVVVSDGGSSDETRERVRDLQCEFKNLYLIGNPNKLQSAGVNLVARSTFAGDILIRADAHALYPRYFVRSCVESLNKEKATSVVVPMRTKGKTSFQRAVAAAQNSIFGNGGAAHRRPGRAGFVDHGHHAAFQRSFFLSIDGYNENFRFNEDAEFDARSHAAGGRIWLCSEAGITYFPRSTVRSLARQYRNHGCGRADTLLCHRMLPKVRQVAPVCIAVSFLGAIALAALWTPAALLAVAILATYMAFGTKQAIDARDISQMGAGLAAAVMHFSWAWGFSARLATKLTIGAIESRSSWPSRLRIPSPRNAQTDVPVGH